MSLIFDQYTERLRRKRKSQHTIRLFIHAAGRLDGWLGAQGLAAETATMDDLETYFAGLELAPSTKNVYLRYIKAAYNYAALRGVLRHNPALDIEEVEEEPREPRVISNQVLREIRDATWRERDWVFFHLLAYTGMRRAEIRSLRWEESVRLEDQTIYVVGKGRKARYIPIHPALGEVLSSCTPENKFVISSAGQNGIAIDTMQEMYKRLHPVYTPHDYRRTVTTSLARNGVEERIIDRIMGWHRGSVRDRFYVNIATAELQRAILKLYADDPL